MKCYIKCCKGILLAICMVTFISACANNKSSSLNAAKPKIDRTVSSFSSSSCSSMSVSSSDESSSEISSSPASESKKESCVGGNGANARENTVGSDRKSDTTKKPAGGSAHAQSPHSARTPSDKLPPASPDNPSPTSPLDYSGLQNEVVRLVNVERSKNGLPSLIADPLLMKTAMVKSQDMAENGYFSHESPTFGYSSNLLKKYGVHFNCWGENIGEGYVSPAQAMNWWMNSPGHRANILRSSINKIGVGVEQNRFGRIYWTQQFIGG